MLVKILWRDPEKKKWNYKYLYSLLLKRQLTFINSPNVEPEDLKKDKEIMVSIRK